LRVSPRKERVIVLDFIANDKKALERRGWVRSLLDQDFVAKDAPLKPELQYDNNGNEIRFTAETVELHTRLEIEERKHPSESFCVSLVKEAISKGRLKLPVKRKRANS
jgi:hypothetical protein